MKRRQERREHRSYTPVTDYRNFTLKKRNDTEYRHLKLLLFWPVFLLLFLFVERIYPVKQYYPVSSFLDEKIPFCALFLFPYLFWYVYLIGMHLYTLLYDIEAFRKMMKFIILTFSVTILIYLIFPTCQQLRPVTFERDNLLNRFVQVIYGIDTNTNVCPSLHVIGSWAAAFAGFHCRSLKGAGWKIGFAVSAVLISISTVFLKQHSVIDVVTAIPICLIAYYICFRINGEADNEGDIHCL